MFPPLEGTISPLFVVFPLVNEKPKPLHNKESKHLLIVSSSDLILKRRLIFRMKTRDSTSNAVLSLNRTALCPVLYCYIHSRADFNFLSEQSRFEVSVETSIHLSQKKKKKKPQAFLHRVAVLVFLCVFLRLRS